MESKVGQRLRYFRRKADISQMQLELQIEASPGSISRIESGEVNPTKETIAKIAKVLNLSDREVDYIAGPLANPATVEEIEKARAAVKDYFNKKGVLAYLMDDRYRLIDLSKDFYKFLEIDPKLKDKLLNQVFINIVLDENLGIVETIKDASNLRSFLERAYSEMYFMFDDEYYKAFMKTAKENPLTKDLWAEITKEPPTDFHDFEDRGVNFSVWGVNIKLDYSIERLQKFPRFDLVQYTPSNKLVKLLTKIL